VAETYVIDIDGTLVVPDKTVTAVCEKCGRAHFPRSTVDRDQVAAVNRLYDRGDTIIIHTARGWDLYRMTINQLSHIGVKYHELVMGKPAGIVIDADARRKIE